MTRKCVHIVGKPVYNEELCDITVPRIEAYARSIGADINMIGATRVFPDYPLTYERMQIYAAGRGYDWNVCIDADMLIGTGVADVTEVSARDTVGAIMTFTASQFFSVDNRFFLRDARNVGIVQSFLVTSDWTHDLWEPLKGTAGIHLGAVANINQVAEYAIAYNLAKYALKFAGALPPAQRVVRVFADERRGITAAEMAKEHIKAWGE